MRRSSVWNFRYSPSTPAKSNPRIRPFRTLRRSPSPDTARIHDCARALPRRSARHTPQNVYLGYLRWPTGPSPPASMRQISITSPPTPDADSNSRFFDSSPPPAVNPPLMYQGEMERRCVTIPPPPTAPHPPKYADERPHPYGVSYSERRHSFVISVSSDPSRGVSPQQPRPTANPTPQIFRYCRLAEAPADSIDLSHLSLSLLLTFPPSPIGEQITYPRSSEIYLRRRRYAFYSLWRDIADPPSPLPYSPTCPLTWSSISKSAQGYGAHIISVPPCIICATHHRQRPRD